MGLSMATSCDCRHPHSVYPNNGAADALRVTMSIARNSVVLCDAQAAAAVYVAETSTYAAHTGTQWKTCSTIC